MARIVRPKLVIIPGIGDDLKVYQTFARRWERLGYEVHVMPFGWYEHTARFKVKRDRFHQLLDGLGGGPLYVIGVSAGGTAAIGLLAERSEVKKVITVCAPLDTLPGLRNPLLGESIAEARQHLANFTSDQRKRILSVFALHDPVVPARLSKPEGVQTLRVPMVLHPAAIFVALMVCAPQLSRFLRAV